MCSIADTPGLVASWLRKISVGVDTMFIDTGPTVVAEAVLSSVQVIFEQKRSMQQRSSGPVISDFFVSVKTNAISLYDRSSILHVSTLHVLEGNNQ